MISFARPVSILLLAAVLLLAGCGMLGGADKNKDGESIGYACRVSGKLPEDCMKENESYSPTSILDGWKTADKDVKDRKVDPLMGKGQPSAEVKEEVSAKAPGDVKAGEAKSEGDKPLAEVKPTADEQAKH